MAISTATQTSYVKNLITWPINMKKAFWFFVIFFSLSNSYAYTCKTQTFAEAFQKNDIVFLGHANSISDVKKPTKDFVFGSKDISFVANKVWKGTKQDQYEIEIGMDPYGWAPFESGKNYLVFAKKHGKRFQFFACGKTKEWSTPIYRSSN